MVYLDHSGSMQANPARPIPVSISWQGGDSGRYSRRWVVILAAASPFTLEGNLLVVDHGMGLNSAFLHQSQIDVKLGDRVRQGQRIGAIGQTGRATGPHLHCSMKWKDERIDPAPIVAALRP